MADAAGGSDDHVCPILSRLHCCHDLSQGNIPAGVITIVDISVRSSQLDSDVFSECFLSPLS